MRQSGLRPLIVLFKDIGEGFSIGKGLNDGTLGGALLSMGSSTSINPNKPIELFFEEYKGSDPVKRVEKQNTLIGILQNNQWNIIVNDKSERQKISEWIDSWLGTSSSSLSDLRVYFNNNSDSECQLTIYDEKGEKLFVESFIGKGKKAQTFSVERDKTYRVRISGHQKDYTVFVKGRLTHIIIDENGDVKINREDQK